MIDIHNHSLFGVDDGARTIEDTKQMLMFARSQGITQIILTPHYRPGMFEYPSEKVHQNFEQVKKAASDINIEVFLGCEYHTDSQMIEHFNGGRCETLGDSDYVLTEYSHNSEYSYIMQNTQRVLSCGYIPVIAHVERYQCLFSMPKRLEELQRAGAYIQLNADSVLGCTGFRMKQFCKKVLKNEWADIIASDAHNMSDRPNRLSQCYEYIEKKFDEDYAKLLFEQNPGQITSSIADE